MLRWLYLQMALSVDSREINQLASATAAGDFNVRGDAQRFQGVESVGAFLCWTPWIK